MHSCSVYVCQRTADTSWANINYQETHTHTHTELTLNVCLTVIITHVSPLVFFFLCVSQLIKQRCWRIVFFFLPQSFLCYFFSVTCCGDERLINSHRLLEVRICQRSVWLHLHLRKHTLFPLSHTFHTKLMFMRQIERTPNYVKQWHYYTFVNE